MEVLENLTPYGTIRNQINGNFEKLSGVLDLKAYIDDEDTGSGDLELEVFNSIMTKLNMDRVVVLDKKGYSDTVIKKIYLDSDGSFRSGSCYYTNTDNELVYFSFSKSSSKCSYSRKKILYSKIFLNNFSAAIPSDIQLPIFAAYGHDFMNKGDIDIEIPNKLYDLIMIESVNNLKLTSYTNYKVIGYLYEVGISGGQVGLLRIKDNNGSGDHTILVKSGEDGVYNEVKVLDSITVVFNMTSIEDKVYIRHGVNGDKLMVYNVTSGDTSIEVSCYAYRGCVAYNGEYYTINKLSDKLRVCKFDTLTSQFIDGGLTIDPDDDAYFLEDVVSHDCVYMLGFNGDIHVYISGTDSYDETNLYLGRAKSFTNMPLEKDGRAGRGIWQDIFKDDSLPVMFGPYASLTSGSKGYNMFSLIYKTGGKMCVNNGFESFTDVYEDYKAAFNVDTFENNLVMLSNREVLYLLTKDTTGNVNCFKLGDYNYENYNEPSLIDNDSLTSIDSNIGYKIGDTYKVANKNIDIKNLDIYYKMYVCVESNNRNRIAKIMRIN